LAVIKKKGQFTVTWIHTRIWLSNAATKTAWKRSYRRN